jgi:glycosyltransferase involved in cell wall biosynthesis
MSTSTGATVHQSATKPRTIRVLHLHSGNIIGGIESMLRTVAEFAPTYPQFQQEIALAFDGPFAASLRATGFKVRILPSPQLRNPFSVLASRRALRQLLADEHFGAVISHSPWCQVVYGPVLKTSSAFTIFWMHGVFQGHWLQRLASRQVPDFAICNSEFAKSTLHLVYPGLPSSVIHYPVKSTEISSHRVAIRDEMQVQPNTVVILMASRMEAWKGHFNLLNAAARISNRSDWTIWIAGTPQTRSEKTYFNSVEAEVKHLQLQDRVRFLGHRSDVPALMRAADIFCQPNSDPEPFGIVFIEALQAGVPIVTFAMGGPSEILNADTGVLVSPGDIAALASRLEKLINDADLRARFRETGPARAQLLCDPAQQLQRLHHAVASALEGEPRKP